MKTQQCKKYSVKTQTWVKQQDGLHQVGKIRCCVCETEQDPWIKCQCLFPSFSMLTNDGISQSQEIVKHAKSVVKCELHVSQMVYVCVHAWTEQNTPSVPHIPFLLISHSLSHSQKHREIRNLLAWAVECREYRFLHLYGSKVIIEPFGTDYKLNPIDRMS